MGEFELSHSIEEANERDVVDVNSLDRETRRATLCVVHLVVRLLSDDRLQ